MCVTWRADVCDVTCRCVWHADVCDAYVDVTGKGLNPCMIQLYYNSVSALGNWFVAAKRNTPLPQIPTESAYIEPLPESVASEGYTYADRSPTTDNSAESYELPTMSVEDEQMDHLYEKLPAHSWPDFTLQYDWIAQFYSVTRLDNHKLSSFGFVPHYTCVLYLQFISCKWKYIFIISF